MTPDRWSQRWFARTDRTGSAVASAPLPRRPSTVVWIPVLLVAVSLLGLAAFVELNRRGNVIGRESQNRTHPAQQMANRTLDLWAAEDAVVRGFVQQADTGMARRYAQDVTRSMNAFSQLDLLAKRVDPTLSTGLATARQRIGEWRVVNDSFMSGRLRPTEYARVFPAQQMRYQAAVGAVHELENALFRAQEGQRSRMSRMAQGSIALAGMLTALAVVAVLAVMLLTLRERRLARKLAIRSEMEGALARMTRALGSSTSVAEMAERATREGAALIGATGAYMERLVSAAPTSSGASPTGPPSEREVIAAWGKGPPEVGTRAPLGGSMTLATISQRIPTLIDRVPTQLGSEHVTLGGPPRGRRLLIPLNSGEEALGALVFLDPPVDVDESLTRALGETASAALRRAALVEELQTANDTLRAVFQAVPLAVISLDRRGNVTSWNLAAERIFGWTAAEAIGKSLQFLGAEEKAEHEGMVQAALKGAVLTTAERRHRRKDGSKLDLRLSSAPLFGPNGKLRGVIELYADITARKRAEEALRRTEIRLRRIAESGIAGVSVSDPTGEIIEANDAYLKILGYTREDLVAGRVDWRRSTPPEWLAVDDAALARLRKDGTIPPYEKEYMRPNGTRVSVLVGGALLEDGSGHNISVCIDITDRVVAQKEREQMLVSEREARGAAERATKLRDEILGVVAHDLRNPVNTIVGSASMLLEDKVSEEQLMKRLNVIKRSAMTMNRLIQDLLDVSRIEAGRLSVTKKRVDPRTLIDDVAELFETQARDRGLDLVCQVAQEVVPILADRDRVSQVLSNLVGNALKFTPEGGRITVRVEPLGSQGNGGGVLFSVADTGPGIPEENLAMVFDRFWQAKTGTKAGAGLGLAIAKGIVDAHEGRIWAESKSGEGSTFRFTIPALAPDGLVPRAAGDRRKTGRIERPL